MKITPYNEAELAEVRRRRGRELPRLFATLDALRRELGLRDDGHSENERDPLVVQIEINAALVAKNRELEAALAAKGK